MAAKLTNAQRAAALATRIAGQVQRGAGKGLLAARTFLVARVKDTLSVPAPRRRVGSRYIATTAATAGAPPRKLTGRLRGSVIGEPLTGASASGRSGRATRPTSIVVGSNVVYARTHELGGHPFLEPTVRHYQAELALIIGTVARVYLVGGSAGGTSPPSGTP